MTTIKDFELARVGDVSEWYSVHEGMRKLGAEMQDEKHRAYYEAEGAKAAGLEVKLRAVDAVEMARWTEGYRQAEGDTEKVMLVHRKVLLDGLAAVRWKTGGIDKIDEKAIADLQTSSVAWMIARMVERFNDLAPQCRQAFFTPGPAA